MVGGAYHPDRSLRLFFTGARAVIVDGARTPFLRSFGSAIKVCHLVGMPLSLPGPTRDIRL
jgi:hypothetical protein